MLFNHINTFCNVSQYPNTNVYYLIYLSCFLRTRREWNPCIFLLNGPMLHSFLLVSEAPCRMFVELLAWLCKWIVYKRIITCTKWLPLLQNISFFLFLLHYKVYLFLFGSLFYNINTSSVEDLTGRGPSYFFLRIYTIIFIVHLKIFPSLTNKDTFFRCSRLEEWICCDSIASKGYFSRWSSSSSSSNSFW